MILTDYFKTYAERVTACKEGLYRPRKLKIGRENQTLSHTSPSDFKRTPTQIRFPPLNGAMCRSTGERHTRSWLRACLMTCSRPSERTLARCGGALRIGITAAGILGSSWPRRIVAAFPARQRLA